MLKQTLDSFQNRPIHRRQVLMHIIKKAKYFSSWDSGDWSCFTTSVTVEKTAFTSKTA